MSQQGMYAAIAAEAEQMQPVRARILHRLHQHRIREERPVFDHEIDTRYIHVDDTPGADIHVADFAVAHLSDRKPDGTPGRLNEGIRKFPQQAIIGRFVRRGNRVALDGRGESPAVENRQNQRLWPWHYWWNAFLPANCAAS